MSFAANIILKQHDSPSWVFKVGTTGAVYYCSVKPASGLTCIAGITSVELPKRSATILGGNATVGQAKITIQDLRFTDGTYSGSKNLYKPALIGAPCQLYLGYAADAWDGEGAAANFKLQWQGYISEAPYEDGIWTITADDCLSRAAGKKLTALPNTADANTVPSPSGNAYFKIHQQYFAKDDYYNVRTRVGFPPIAEPTNLVANGGFETGTTAGWTSVALSAAVGTTNPSPSAGSYRAELTPTSVDVSGYIYQDVTLSGHKPGMIYAALIKLRRKSTATAMAFGRVSLQGMDVSGYIYEVYHNSARQVKNEGWGLHSGTICIYHPATTKIRVGVHVTRSGADTVFVDEIRLVRLSYTASVKREAVGIVSVSESTTPTQMVISHGLFNTRECNQSQKQKGKIAKALGGFAGDVILRLLTTTTAGTNGAWDHGDGFGCGIPVAMIDTATFAVLYQSEWDTLGYLCKVALVVDEDITDLLAFIIDELLAPFALSMWVNSAGVLTAKFSPHTYTHDDAKALTDAKWCERPTVERVPGDMVNQIYYRMDYDPMGAVETPQSEEEYNTGKGKNRQPRPTAPTDDTNYVGQWTFSESNYLMSGALSDADKALQVKYGLKEITVKAKGLRSLVSYAAGMPVLMEVGASLLAYGYAQNGEMAARAYAQRVLPAMTSPPAYVTWRGYSELWLYEPGDVLQITCAGLPDLHPSTGGGMGIAGVNSVVESVQPNCTDLTVELRLRILDWAEAIVQDTYTGTSDPSGSTVQIATMETERLTSGNYAWVLKGKFAALKVVQSYGGVIGAAPTFANYQYTEVRIYWNSKDIYGLGYQAIARFTDGHTLIALHGVNEVDTSTLDVASAQVYYRYKNGSYSAAYTITGLDNTMQEMAPALCLKRGNLHDHLSVCLTPAVWQGTGTMASGVFTVLTGGSLAAVTTAHYLLWNNATYDISAVGSTTITVLGGPPDDSSSDGDFAFVILAMYASPIPYARLVIIRKSPASDTVLPGEAGSKSKHYKSFQLCPPGGNWGQVDNEDMQITFHGHHTENPGGVPRWYARVLYETRKSMWGLGSGQAAAGVLTAIASVTPAAGSVDTTFTFDANASGGTTSYHYSWTWDNPPTYIGGTSSASKSPQVKWPTPASAVHWGQCIVTDSSSPVQTATTNQATATVGGGANALWVELFAVPSTVTSPGQLYLAANPHGGTGTYSAYHWYSGDQDLGITPGGPTGATGLFTVRNIEGAANRIPKPVMCRVDVTDSGGSIAQGFCVVVVNPPVVTKWQGVATWQAVVEGGNGSVWTDSSGGTGAGYLDAAKDGNTTTYVKTQIPAGESSKYLWVYGFNALPNLAANSVILMFVAKIIVDPRDTGGTLTQNLETKWVQFTKNSIDQGSRMGIGDEWEPTSYQGLSYPWEPILMSGSWTPCNDPSQQGLWVLSDVNTETYIGIKLKVHNAGSAAKVARVYAFRLDILYVLN